MATSRDFSCSGRIKTDRAAVGSSSTSLQMNLFNKFPTYKYVWIGSMYRVVLTILYYELTIRLKIVFLLVRFSDGDVSAMISFIVIPVPAPAPSLPTTPPKLTTVTTWSILEVE
jgi:hypothetical protein